MFRSAGKPIDYLLSPEDIIRFLGKVEVIDLPGTKSHGCWKWIGGMLKDGYGRFKVGGSDQRSHRIAFQVFVGALSLGEDVHHRCRNIWCVNPRHLEAMTHSENVADGNANRTIAICFFGGPLDGTEKFFRPSHQPERFQIKSHGRTDWYEFSEETREYVYEGFKKVKKR